MHRKRIAMVLIHARSDRFAYLLSLYHTVIFESDTTRRLFAVCLARAVPPIAEIALLSVRRKFCSRSSVYTRASPRRCTIFRPAAAVSFNAGFYDRAWVRKYNPVTQVRRRNSGRTGTSRDGVRNDSRKLRQLRRESEICTSVRR